MKLKLTSFLPFGVISKNWVPGIVAPAKFAVSNVLFAEVLYNILCSREKLQIRYANLRV
ncbi:hypothetical protein ACLI1A_04520 [Flavobacterium sp. RHBU_3]|uniref:hypothetical protein n=1 Tax=Flavobacterium sp. RHBU_3 TaxID=3391184 RepID=UPI0039852F94